ncbi:hypothetical protein TPA0907_41590 [Micromonospora humidisoli]|uniref:Ribulose 1,5-bisphosphate carboxylase large subunit n=1 Tax=Micromonospora humidisoli TaxID=2807622 RepID=A0ABS2J5M3_9ACTN|nr:MULTISPECIES: hypothetical protein [Micromonospora]MBM7081400.1 hypothetical protein [Micromonospora humidisoli]GHJ09792.1 hypothetical protein TPA0907_41590 [Micromonospora sp. AKA109]
MAIPLPRPAAVVGLTRSALDQAFGSAASFAAVPARAFAVLDGVEALLARINGVVDRIEGTLDRTDRVLTDAEEAVREVAVISAAATTAITRATDVADAAAGVVAGAGQVSRAAGVVVAEAEAVADRAAGTVATAGSAATVAAELLAAYEPALRRGAPMANRFVAELSHEELAAAIRLVDELPKLKEHLTSDVLPILATLDRVGPDLHDLLDVTRDLKLAVAGIPGLGMLRRRGERLSDDPAG